MISLQVEDSKDELNCFKILPIDGNIIMENKFTISSLDGSKKWCVILINFSPRGGGGMFENINHPSSIPSEGGQRPGNSSSLTMFKTAVLDLNTAFSETLDPYCMSLSWSWSTSKKQNIKRALSRSLTRKQNFNKTSEYERHCPGP